MSELWLGALIGALVSIPVAIIFGYLVNLTTPYFQRRIESRSSKARQKVKQETADDRKSAAYLIDNPLVATHVQRTMLLAIGKRRALYWLYSFGTWGFAVSSITQLFYNPHATLWSRIFFPVGFVYFLVVATRNVYTSSRLKARYDYIARIINNMWPFDLNYYDVDEIGRYPKISVPPTESTEH